jgi:hypothetical protein
MHFEPTDMMIGEESKDYKLVGQASDELDAAWSELMADFFTDVPYSYVESVGRLDEGIPTKSGGFLGTYSFMHQLHCVVCLLLIRLVGRAADHKKETYPPFILARTILPEHN